jgi:general secretion pathway protein J
MTRRQRGFTLLEMLVALLVFGLVMAGITQTFRFGLVAWRAADRAGRAPGAMAALDAALTSMIGQAQPGSMTGHPDGLEFTTRLPAGAGLNRGLADVAITVQPDGEFLLFYGPHPPGIILTTLPAPLTEPLAYRVRRLDIAYLIHRASAPPVWAGKWSGDGLPLLVRIHLDLEGGQEWPDLIVAPVDRGD